MLVEPVAVGLPRGELALDLARRRRCGRASRSTRNSLPGLQAALARRSRRRRGRARRSRRRARPSRRLVSQPAAGPQAVAVERRADHAAVGERDRGGAVPRLHQARVVLRRSRAGRSGRSSRPSQASGIIIITACGSERPREHEQLEHVVEASPSPSRPGATIGRASAGRRRTARTRSCDSRARIQLTLPRSVLISPLWAMSRYGCASSQLGNVLVEKRECTSASARRDVARRAGRGRSAQLRAREHALVDDRAAGEADGIDEVRRRAAISATRRIT